MEMINQSIPSSPPEQSNSRRWGPLFLVIISLAVVSAIAVYLSIYKTPQAPNPLVVCKTSGEQENCYNNQLLDFEKDVGVTQTLELIRKTASEFPEAYQQCNYPLGHELGIRAYSAKQDVLQALDLSRDCSTGFLRGVMSAFFNAHSNLNIVEAKEKACSPEQGAGWSCHYRMGYFALDNAGSLSEASLLCDKLTENIELRTACFAGAITEAMFLIENKENYKVRYDSKLYGPSQEFDMCNALPLQSRPICYQTVPSRYLFASAEKLQPFLVAPLDICNTATTDHKKDCSVGIGFALDALFVSNKRKVLDRCLSTSDSGIARNCLSGALARQERTPGNSPEQFEQKKIFCELFPDAHKTMPRYMRQCIPLVTGEPVCPDISNLTAQGQEQLDGRRDLDKLSQDERRVLDLATVKLSSTENKEFMDLIEKLAQNTTSIDIGFCSPKPVVVRVKMGELLTIENTGENPRTLTIQNYSCSVLPGKKRMISTDFGKGTGRYGFNCDSSISPVGIFRVTQ